MGVVGYIPYLTLTLQGFKVNKMTSLKNYIFKIYNCCAYLVKTLTKKYWKKNGSIYILIFHNKENISKKVASSCAWAKWMSSTLCKSPKWQWHKRMMHFLKRIINLKSKQCSLFFFFFHQMVLAFQRLPNGIMCSSTESQQPIYHIEKDKAPSMSY